MSDGANIGMSAGRALKTIFGGEDPPADDERMTISELEQRIRSRPLPGEGKPPFESDDDDAYSVATEIIAHAFLVLADDDPTLLTRRETYTEADFSDQDKDWWKNLVGKQKDPTTAAWNALKERWPNADEWIGGATGFMVGWAFNAVLTIKDQQPVPNPAIMTIGGDNE